MKKRIWQFVLSIAIVVAAGWNIHQNRKTAEISDITVANIEALAGGEDEGDKPKSEKWSSFSSDCFDKHGNRSGRRVICFQPGFSDSCIATGCN
jgi:hypothetical protein